MGANFREYRRNLQHLPDEPELLPAVGVGNHIKTRPGLPAGLRLRHDAGPVSFLRCHIGDLTSIPGRPQPLELHPMAAGGGDGQNPYRLSGWALGGRIMSIGRGAVGRHGIIPARCGQRPVPPPCWSGRYSEMTIGKTVLLQRWIMARPARYPTQKCLAVPCGAWRKVLYGAVFRLRRDRRVNGKG